MTEPSHPFLDNAAPLAFAHRGGATTSPENTLAAFQDAVALGYKYLETDVHASADGMLLAFHDDDLSRTCGVEGRIRELPWKVLRNARVEGREPIPKLEDILGSFSQAHINIDCKSDQALEPLIAAIRRTNSLDRVCVGSFSDRRLRRLRAALGTGLCTSAGPAEVARLVLASVSVKAISSRNQFHAAQVPVSQGPIPVVTERFIRSCHSVGVQVHVWTIDDPAEMAKLLDLGVDGLMTDDTRALKDLLVSRGEWT